MQKVSILIFSLFASLTTFAQNALVIDNNQNHHSLFDDNDPFSFVSLVRSNSYYLGYMELEGMNPDLYEKLSEKDQQNVAAYVGQPGTVPLKDEDPESENFGKPLIHTDPETGQQSFIYQAPDTTYVMLEDIDRIVITYEEGEKPSRDNASRVFYYKLLNGVYEPVLSVNAEDLLSFDGFSYVRELDDKTSDVLLSDSPNSLWTDMRSTALKQKEMYDGSKFGKWRYDLKLTYFPADAMRFGFFNLGEEPVDLRTWEKEREVIYPALNEKIEEAQYPFGMNLGSGVVTDTVGRSELLASFDEVHSDYEISKKPLVDRDPHSPNFGKELVVEYADGTKEIQYPAPKEVFFWIEHSDANIYVKESFHSNGESANTTTDVLYFTTEVDGKEEVISAIAFRGAVEEYLPNYESFTLSDMEFQKTLNKAFGNKKLMFDLNDSSVRKTLKMNE